jgi:hypothetical protein
MKIDDDSPSNDGNKRSLLPLLGAVDAVVVCYKKYIELR